MPETCDIAVVGAGPAGSSCAALLAQRGYDVTLIDQHDFPRDKPCGDGLTPRAVEILTDLGFNNLLEAAQPILGCRVVVDHRRERYVARYPEHAPARCLERSKLDKALFDGALASGARFAKRRATGVRGVTADTPVVELGSGDTTTGLLAARVVAACDGATSTIRRSAQLGTPGHAVRAWAIRGYYKTERQLDPCFDIYFPLEVHGTPLLGYGWVFPIGEHLANIGVGYFRPPGVGHLPRVNDALDTFVEDLRRRSSRRFGDLEAVGRASGSPIAVNFTTRGSSLGNLLLVGDAAGTTDPFTGEGIEPALMGGTLASEQIISALTRGTALSSHAREVGRQLPRAGQDFSSIGRTLTRLFDTSTLGTKPIKRLRFISDVIADAPEPEPHAYADTPIAVLLRQIDPVAGSAIAQIHGELYDAIRNSLPLSSPALARHIREQGGPIYAAASLMALLACGGEPDSRALAGARAAEHLAPFADLLTTLTHRPTGDMHVLNNALAVLTADLSVSEAMIAAAEVGARAAGDLARAAQRMCEGAMLDDAHRFDLDRPVDDYLAAVRLSTGSILSFAVGLGAGTAGAPGPLVDRIRSFGETLGVAYRLCEEAHAFRAPDLTQQTLKQAIRHGVYTLPLLLACDDDPRLRRTLIARPDDEDLDDVAQQIHGSGALSETHRIIREHIASSKASLGTSLVEGPTWFDVLAEWLETRSDEALGFRSAAELSTSA